MKLGPDKRLVIKETKHAEWIQFHGLDNCENTEAPEKGVTLFNIGRIYLHSCYIREKKSSKRLQKK